MKAIAVAYRGLGALAAGLISAVATAALVAIIFTMIGYNILSYKIWDYVPAGAIACGLVAGMGLYAACLLMHIRPNKMLLIAPIVMAVATQALIYYFEYWILRAAGSVPPTLSPVAFAESAFTGAPLSVDISRYSLDLGAVGPLGYVSAAIEFAGFCMGGFLVYALLKDHPWCVACNRYLRSITSKQSYFPDRAEYEEYWHVTSDMSPDTPEFTLMVAPDRSTRIDREAATYLRTELYGCSGCGEQRVKDTGQIYENGGWKQRIDIDRVLSIPANIDVKSLYFPEGVPADPVSAWFDQVQAERPGA